MSEETKQDYTQEELEQQAQLKHFLPKGQAVVCQDGKLPRQRNIRINVKGSLGHGAAAACHHQPQHGARHYYVQMTRELYQV